MFFSILLLLVFIVTIIFLGHKKHITMVLFCYFFGVTLMITASIIYTIKTSSYIPPYEFDNYLYYYIYPIFTKLNMGISNVAYMLNAGLSLILAGSAYQVKMLYPQKKFFFKIEILLIALFFMLNSPIIRYFEFINSYSNEKTLSSFFIHIFAAYTNAYSIFFFAFMLVLPFVALVKLYFSTQIHILKKNIVATVLFLLCIDVFIAYYFIFGMFSPFMPWRVNFLKFPVSSINVSIKTLYIPFLILICIAEIYIMIKVNPFDSQKFRTKKAILKEYSELNHSLRMIFHVNKNILQTIYLLSEQAINNKKRRPEITEKNLRDIKNMSSDSQKTLIRMMYMLDDVSLNFMKTNVISVMNSAISKAAVPDYIQIETLYDNGSELYIKAEELHITECFVNIIKNAVEAIESSQNDNGKITIFISEDNYYANIEITDNGCGIPKKKYKSIFNILNSSKQSSTNWGIGLSYVKKVVSVYGGDISVKSELGKYAKFQISFPIYSEEKHRKNYLKFRKGMIKND